MSADRELRRLMDDVGKSTVTGLIIPEGLFFPETTRETAEPRIDLVSRRTKLLEKSKNKKFLLIKIIIKRILKKFS